MATSDKPLSIVSGKPTVLTTGDTLTFNCDVVFAGTSAVASVGDGTGSFGFLGAAGALSSSAVTTITMAGGTNDAVSLSSTGTGTLALRSATGAWTGGDGTGYMTLSGSGAFSTTGMTTLDLDASGALQINSSGGAISIGNDAVNQAVNIATGGTRTLTVGGTGTTHAYVAKPSTTVAWSVSDGTTTFLSLNTNGVFSVNSYLSLLEGSNASTKAISVAKTAGATIAVGDILAYAITTGKMVKADASSGGGSIMNPVGTCAFASTDTNPTQLAIGGEVPATFASAPAAASIGLEVYLSETAGQATLTAPTTSGSVVYRLGYLAFANASDTTCRILWQPQLMYVA